MTKREAIEEEIEKIIYLTRHGPSTPAEIKDAIIKCFYEEVKMPKLTIYSPDTYFRPDKSDRDHFLKEELIGISTEGWVQGFIVTFHLPDKRAILYGDLKLTWEQAEQLRDEIDARLKDFAAPTIKEE